LTKLHVSSIITAQDSDATDVIKEISNKFGWRLGLLFFGTRHPVLAIDGF